MKKIELLSERKLVRVKMLLAALGYHGMTIAEVSGLVEREGFHLNWVLRNIDGVHA